VATFVVCEGKNGAQLLRKLGCQIEKIRIVKLGIDIASIPYFTRLKRANALALVQAATFTETKGLLYTVQAFLLALKECPQMTLTLVGEKWDKRYWEKVERLITSSGHLDKIQVLDFVENDFHQFISRFDVFIHPSCYSSLMECEGGAPIVLLDAQAVGLPIISTVHCDIPEEVVDGQTGFLSNERDVVSLKNSIVRFYHMENEEYQGFSHRARKHVFEHYDSVKNSQAMKIVYDEALLSGKKTLAD
jgi:colanic acid/amylovoran biosynthesis glycosyltransferase